MEDVVKEISTRSRIADDEYFVAHGEESGDLSRVKTIHCSGGSNIFSVQKTERIRLGEDINLLV